MGWILKNYIGTKREFKTFYKKGIGVLLEITSGNIKKKRLKLKELVKNNKQATWASDSRQENGKWCMKFGFAKSVFGA